MLIKQETEIKQLIEDAMTTDGSNRLQIPRRKVREVVKLINQINRKNNKKVMVDRETFDGVPVWKTAGAWTNAEHETRGGELSAEKAMYWYLKGFEDAETTEKQTVSHEQTMKDAKTHFHLVWDCYINVR